MMVLSLPGWWLHYLALFASAPTLICFYLIAHVQKLLPWVLTVWGLLGAFLLGLAMAIAILGGDTLMFLMLPLGLNRLAVIVWLFIKGFGFVETAELSSQ